MKKVIRGKRNILLLCAALLAAVLCIVLPEKAIDYKKSKFTETCMDMPEEYYPTSSYFEVTKEFSEKLSEYQKRQLIGGLWKSDISEVDREYYEESPYQIEESTKAIINRLNDKGFYPSTIESSYQFWYIWDAKFYQALDMNFKTYAGYFWKTSFELFNGADAITIFTTPEGRTIKAIYSSEEKIEETKSFSLTKTQELATMMLGSGFEVKSVEAARENQINWVKEYLASDFLTEELGVDQSDTTEESDTSETQAEIEEKQATKDNNIENEQIIVNKVSVLDNTENSSNSSQSDYYIYIYQSSNKYMIGLIPVE